MGLKRGRESGSDGEEVEYEKLRNDRLRENQKRMEELGLLGLSQSLSESTRTPGRPSPRTPSSIPRVIVPAGPARRSSRLSGSPVISYAETPKKESEGKEKKAGRRANEAGTGGYQLEIYTEEDEKLLGDAKMEWQLFVDGYDGKGTRIYDPVRGKTCHQCRQKTMGLRTSCSSCQSLHGQFCGDCLYMRYGENLVEANQNENWECPVCRKICNCSFCRLKRGWTPTGSLYRRVKSLGYKSVAHYLVLTRRGGNEDAEEKVVPKGGDIKVNKTPKVKEAKELRVKEEVTPVSQMHMEDLLSAAKQEMHTLETGDEKPPSKLIAAKVEMAILAPRVKTEVLTSLVMPIVEKPFKLEKVPAFQPTLLSAGFRSRRAVSTRSKVGGKEPNNLKGSDVSVQTTNDSESETADVKVEKQQRRGRPRKNPPSGKASFYGSAPRTRNGGSGLPILVLASDSEDDFTHTQAPATIAQRLQRRRGT